jgi:hypothetical protein
MMIAPSASNTDADVQRSSNNRRPSWSGALLMLGARLGFAVAVQAIVAWVFFLRWLSVSVRAAVACSFRRGRCNVQLLAQYIPRNRPIQ